MAIEYGKTGVKIRRYVAMIRAAATVDVTDQAGYEVLRATFLERLGICEDKSVKIACLEGDSVILNDGSKRVLSYKGTFELKHLNIDFDNLEDLDGYTGTDVDILLIDEDNDLEIIAKNIDLSVEEEYNDGDKIVVTLKAEKTVAEKSKFREYWNYTQPT